MKIHYQFQNWFYVLKVLSLFHEVPLIHLIFVSKKMLLIGIRWPAQVQCINQLSCHWNMVPDTAEGGEFNLAQSLQCYGLYVGCPSKSHV